MLPFSESWSALRSAVAQLEEPDFERASGCAGWLVRDLVCHLIIDAQDVLITLATPTESTATRDAVTYWHVATERPDGTDPLDALIVRLAAAYQDPHLLTFHLDDVGSAAGRAAELADPEQRVITQGEVLTVDDYLSAYVFEWTVHHLDLISDIPEAPGPPLTGLAESRRMLEAVTGTSFPDAITDADALLIGTGRRSPTAEELTSLGDVAPRLPFVIG